MTSVFPCIPFLSFCGCDEDNGFCKTADGKLGPLCVGCAEKCEKLNIFRNVEQANKILQESSTFKHVFQNMVLASDASITDAMPPTSVGSTFDNKMEVFIDITLLTAHEVKHVSKKTGKALSLLPMRAWDVYGRPEENYVLLNDLPAHEIAGYKRMRLGAGQASFMQTEHLAQGSAKFPMHPMMVFQRLIEDRQFVTSEQLALSTQHTTSQVKGRMTDFKKRPSPPDAPTRNVPKFHKAEKQSPGHE